jgi:predicted porin
MKIKKLLILTVAGMIVSSTLALANGTGRYAKKTPMTKAPMPMVLNSPGVYIEGLVGYNRYAFKDALHSGLPWNHGQGNWAFAADLGYQFHPYISLEIGGITSLKAEEAGVKHRPWYGYLAAKIATCIFDNISVFAKFGAGFQSLIDNGDADQNNWGPMFGAGFGYYFTPQFYLTGEWLRFTGKVEEEISLTSSPNIFLLGLGYKFML